MHHHFRRPQAMLNKGSLFYIQQKEPYIIHCQGPKGEGMGVSTKFFFTPWFSRFVKTRLKYVYLVITRE
jgi:hypothetical protein